MGRVTALVLPVALLQQRQDRGKAELDASGRDVQFAGRYTEETDKHYNGVCLSDYLACA